MTSRPRRPVIPSGRRAAGLASGRRQAGGVQQAATGRPLEGGPKLRRRYTAAGALSSIWRGSNVSRAMTSRWICAVPS